MLYEMFRTKKCNFIYKFLQWQSCCMYKISWNCWNEVLIAIVWDAVLWLCCVYTFLRITLGHTKTSNLQWIMRKCRDAQHCASFTFHVIAGIWGAQITPFSHIFKRYSNARNRFHWICWTLSGWLPSCCVLAPWSTDGHIHWCLEEIVAKPVVLAQCSSSKQF